MTKISVFIIAKNEEDRIARAIKSVALFADEVIVVDSGSSDNTVAVADRLGAKVIFHEWKGYGPQKVFGESLCRNDWILNIDADEEITEALAEEILSTINHQPSTISAYRLKIKLLLWHEDKPPFFAPMNNPVRLYNRRFGGFDKSAVHDSVIMREGEVGEFQNIVLHRTFRDLKHWCEKLNYYSTLQAEDFINKGRKPYALRIILEWPFAFLKAYFIRRFFLYGVDGFVASFMYAYGRFLRMAKARELLKENESKNG